ncbi:MAG: glycosyltransferase family 4 protein [Planctomycetota bacterium]
MSRNDREEKKVKLAVVTAADGTIKALLFAQVKVAQQAGYQVHGICTKSQHFSFLTQSGIIMHPVTIKRKISPFSDLVSFWKMYRYFKKQKLDIVHTHTPKCSLLGQLAAKLAGVPIIINTVHGFYFHDYMNPWLRRFYIAMEWVAARCSTIILSQNPEDIKTAIKLKICRPDKIKLLGNGVNLEKFSPARFNSNFKIQKRQEIDVPRDAVVIGIIGRLVKEKGFLELFEAFKEIINEHNNVWLVIIGPEEPEKTDRISSDTFKEYGVENKTIYLGTREDIPELLACCDIYTLPSWREGYPRSAIEAAALALPIVATNIRGCRQVVEDGVTGLLVPLGDKGALASAIRKLVEDKELREKMGQAGHEKAQREFDERRVCGVVISIYKELLDKKYDNN